MILYIYDSGGTIVLKKETNFPGKQKSDKYLGFIKVYPAEEWTDKDEKDHILGNQINDEELEDEELTYNEFLIDKERHG